MIPAKSTFQVVATLAVLLLFGLSVGCNGFFVDPTLTSIAVSPTSPAVTVGKTIQLSAFGTYDDGSRKSITSGVDWSSGTPTVASIDSKTGIATGVTAGSTTITASSQGLSGSASMTVLPSSVTSITIIPTAPSIRQGGTQQFTATAQDGTDITNIVGWTSSDTTQVTISSSGLATSIGTVNGNTPITITASITTDAGTVSKSVILIVTL
jgi:trimeric autotransporter adhesin